MPSGVVASPLSTLTAIHTHHQPSGDPAVDSSIPTATEAFRKRSEDTGDTVLQPVASEAKPDGLQYFDRNTLAVERKKGSQPLVSLATHPPRRGPACLYCFRALQQQQQQQQQRVL